MTVKSLEEDAESEKRAEQAARRVRRGCQLSFLGLLPTRRPRFPLGCNLLLSLQFLPP